MEEYEVYFELFGKNMKVVINANSSLDAQDKVRGKIVFHKVKKKAINESTPSGKKSDEDIVNELLSLFGIKK